MNRMIDFLDLNALRNSSALPSITPLAVGGSAHLNPPHTLLESPSSFSIVMNLLGIDQEDISIRVDESKREIAVLAKKEVINSKRGFFWIFGVPSEGAINLISTRYKGGVLEISVPKCRSKRRLRAVA